MKKPQYYCDKCHLMLGEADALHHKDQQHKILDLRVDEEYFEEVEREGIPS